MNSLHIEPKYILFLFSWWVGSQFTAAENTINSNTVPSELNILQTTTTLTIADVTANEDDGMVSISVTLNNIVLGGFSVDVSTESGSATTQDGDFTAITSQTLTFLGVAGETVSFSVNLGTDSKVEIDETFIVSMDNVQGLLISEGDVDASDTGTVTILNDDSATLQIANVSGDEGGGAITLTATLDHAVDGGFTVDVNTTNGTATGGTDFTALSGETLTFSGSAGETQDFAVTPIDDSDVESDETLTISMNNLVVSTVASGAIDVSDEATVTIVNDDQAQPTVEISVDNATVSEGNTQSTLTFTVRLNEASGSSVTVDYATADGTATSGSDYDATSGTLSFAAGEISKTISVTVQGDQLVERDETLTIALSNNTGQSSISDNTGAGTINNDDVATVLIANVSGDEGGGAITLTATLDHAVDGGFTVDVNTTNGTATGGTDFTALSGETLTFSGSAGETQDFAVTPIDDSDVESDETLTISMNNLVVSTVASGAIDVSDEATVTIVDDDQAQSTVEISIDDATVLEGNTQSSLTFTVRLNEASGSSVTVDYATADGTATSGSDYDATSGTLSFAAGEISKTISVAVQGDQLVERDETLTIALSNNTGQSSISDNTGAGTINNDDVATVLIANVSGDEGGGAITLTATLDHAVDGGFTVDVNTTNGTATGGTDFTALSGETLTFSGSAGETQDFAVTPIDDSDVESDETLTISMNNLVVSTVASGAIDVSDEATVTIVDDDQAQSTVEISIDDATVSEGNTQSSLTFTVRLNEASGSSVTVDYATADGTATSGSDYDATSGTLSFAAGEISKTISVTVQGDQLVERDETLTIALSNNTGQSSISDNTGAGTINNDDVATVLIANVSGDEGGGAITLTATLDHAVDGGFTVDVNTTNGTATGGTDFTALSGETLTFSGSAGETQGFAVTPIDDSDVESDETLTVSMTNLVVSTVSSGAIDVSDEATVTIVNDDQAQSTVEISIDDATVSEGNTQSTITFTVRLNEASGSSVTVDYATADGTATSGSDYDATSGTLSFAAGETSKTISVTVQGDQLVERDETFTIALSNNTGQSSISDNTGAGTINNDDVATVLIANVSGDEGGGAITLTATLDHAVDGGFTVDVNTTNGTATGGTDFTALSGETLTFSGSAGETQGFAVTPIDDSDVESDETLTVSMTNLVVSTVSSGAIDVSDEATVTIVDDDQTTDHTPVVVAGQVFEISESMENGDQLGNVLASDADPGTTFSNWKILSGNEAGIFALDANTGILSVANISQIDSSQDEYILTVSVSDGTNTSEAASVTVNVVNGDITGPGVSITSEVLDITNQQEVMIGATFDTKVSGFDLNDILATNSEASDLSTDDNMVYTFKVLASSDGIVTISIPASSAQDEAGNWNKSSNKISYFYDGTAPTATLSLGDQDQITEATIFIDFSESITGLTEDDFELTTGSISSLSGSLNAYTLKLTNIDDGQTVTLVEGAVSDEAGNINQAVSITVSGDVTGPTEFIPSFVDAVVNILNQESISFQIAQTEKGSTYTYQIVSGDSSETIEGSGSSMGGTVVEGGFDLSNFPDGEILLFVTMSDEAGNIGSTKSDQIIKDTSVDIPQGISPNGDGANDTWVIPGIEGFPENRVTIFNRWGNMVYQVIGYNNQTKVFAGRSNNDFSLGNTLSNGTYFFVIDLHSEDVRKGYLIINK